MCYTLLSFDDASGLVARASVGHHPLLLILPKIYDIVMNESEE